MYQYSGPGSQQVANQWNSSNDYWFMMLTQQGYIVACVDMRTGFSDLTQEVTHRIRESTVEDQIDAAKVIENYSFVDKSRIGIFIWSYGFMSSNRSKERYFKMQCSSAGNKLRFYDSIYMQTHKKTQRDMMKIHLLIMQRN
jgi:dipeptidyl-peptidase-4